MGAIFSEEHKREVEYTDKDGKKVVFREEYRRSVEVDQPTPGNQHELAKVLESLPKMKSINGQLK